jgi:cytochrome bd-type quinol oxidase subunit 2
MGSYGLSLDPTPTIGPPAMPQAWVTALLLVSFALFGSGFIMLAVGLRRAPGAAKMLAASVLLSLLVVVLVGVVSFAPVGAGDSGLRDVDRGVLLLVCLDAMLLLAPTLFSTFAAARTADADPRVWLCLVAGALIMILGDALYPLVNQSGESVLASLPWGMAVALFGLGALLSADAAEAAESRIDTD